MKKYIIVVCVSAIMAGTMLTGVINGRYGASCKPRSVDEKCDSDEYDFEWVDSLPTYVDCLCSSGGQEVQSELDDLESCKKAARSGNADAQVAMGHRYSSGSGVGQNYAEAVRWYQKAANQGDRNGELNMGIAYEFGYGVKQDYEKAMRWYRKAADHGERMAMFQIAMMYEEGKGVPKDSVEAEKWYKKADIQGI